MSDKDTGALATDGKQLDNHKLNLTAEDFHKIDSDSDNRLSLIELTSAAKNGKFSGEKQSAVEGLREDLEKRPAQGSDKDKQGIESWHTIDFAMNQISKDDFKRIDSNKDNVLSTDELKAAKDDKDLSSMSKHAADVFVKEQSNGASDKRFVVHKDAVMNWHELDPEFKNVENAELAKYAELDNAKGVNAANELVKRFDFQMTQAEAVDGIKAIALIQEALKTNRDIGVEDGKITLTDKPLSDERRLEMHAAILGDIQTITSQVQMRQHLASLLENQGKSDEAEKVRSEAIARSDFLTNKVKTDKGETRLVDLMKAEVTQLTTDAAATEDMTRRNDMTNASEYLKEIVQVPIETRLQDARANLGLSYVQLSDKSVGIRIDTSAKGFNIDKAEQRSKEAKDLSIDIVGVDPSTSNDSRVTSLFGASWKEIDPKSKFNFYRDGNKNGKVDVLDRIREMKKYNESWKANFGVQTELE